MEVKQLTTYQKTRVPSKIKTILITFFDSNGIINKQFVPSEQTITRKHYLNVVKRFVARIRCIRPYYQDVTSCCLVHEHAAVTTQSIFDKK